MRGMEYKYDTDLLQKEKKSVKHKNTAESNPIDVYKNNPYCKITIINDSLYLLWLHVWL